MSKGIRYYLDKEILTKDEAANMLSVSISTVERYVNNQGLPRHKKENNQPFFLASELYEWIKSG